MSYGEETGPQRRYCGNCGTRVKPGNKFCESCGQSLEPRSEPRPRPQAASHQGPTEYSTVPRNRSAVERAVLTQGQRWFLVALAVVGTIVAVGWLALVIAPFASTGTRLSYVVFLGVLAYLYYRLWQNDRAVRYLNWKSTFEKRLQEDKNRLDRINPHTNPDSEVSAERYQMDLNAYEHDRRYFEQEVTRFEG